MGTRPPGALGKDVIGEWYYEDTPVVNCAWCHKLAVAKFTTILDKEPYCARCLAQPAPLSYVQGHDMPLHIGLRLSDYGADDGISGPVPDGDAP